MIFDPISDMFTIIRNANSLCHKEALIPSSKIKVAIADILKREGFITDFIVEQDSAKKKLKIILKYGKNNEKVIHNIKRVSKPSLRVTDGYRKIPHILKGFGIAIISTNKGVITDKEARKLKVGGEILAYVW